MQSLRSSILALVVLVLGLIPVVAAPPAGLKGAGAEADRWLVDNADFVLLLNVKQLAASEAVKAGGADALKEAVKAEPRATAIFEAAGIEPLKDVDSVMFSGTFGGKGNEVQGTVVIQGRFNPEKAIASAAKKNDKSVEEADGVKLIRLQVQGHDAFAGFANKERLVISHSRSATIQWLKAGAKSEAKMTAGMKSALASFKGAETVTFAMVLNDDLRKAITRVPQFAVAGAKLQTVTCSLMVSDTATLSVTGSTSDPKAARQIQTGVSTLKDLAAVLVSEDSVGTAATAILQEMKIALDGNDVKVTLTIDKALIEKAMKK